MNTSKPTSFLIAASDTAFEVVDASHIAIMTGARTCTLESTPEQTKDLLDVLANIVPLLKESESLARDLSQPQRETLQPYIEDFIKLGVVLEAPPDIDTEAKRRLFTFLSRRANNAREIYAQARRQDFCISGPHQFIEPWRSAFEAQGLSIQPSKTPDSISLELVTNAAEIPRLSKQHHSAGTAWAPLVLNPTGASIGPWVIPGETACPLCPELAVTGSQPAGPPQDANSSWLSLQTGPLSWVGGVLTHLALRVVAPVGPHSPWGRRIDLDFLRTEQKTVSVWKNPFCAVCGPTSRPQRVWSEQWC